jgi:hypothetical protein
VLRAVSFRLADHPGVIPACPESLSRVGPLPQIPRYKGILGSTQSSQSRRSLTSGRPALKMKRLKNYTSSE